MKEMSVGDSGVLQNLDYYKWLEGTVAEIVSEPPDGTNVVIMDDIDFPLPEHPVWAVRLCTGYYKIIRKTQIRPLSDPDQKTQTEQREITA